MSMRSSMVTDMPCLCHSAVLHELAVRRAPFLSSQRPSASSLTRAWVGVVDGGQQRFYLVGSDAGDQVHRVLKIDRTTPGHELLLIEDEAVYSSKQVSVVDSLPRMAARVPGTLPRPPFLVPHSSTPFLISLPRPPCLISLPSNPFPHLHTRVRAFDRLHSCCR